MIVPPNGYTAVGPPQKPTDWLAYLYGKLTERWAETRKYGQYYEGIQQNLAFSQIKYREAFKDVFGTWRDNFCGLIIDSATERMFVEGFRIPSDAAESDRPAGRGRDFGADKDARDFWQHNQMDALSNSVHLDALVHGWAYVLVWAKESGEPIITPVSPEEMVVQYKPGSRTELEAAARFFRDAWGRQWVTLWTEAYVYEVTGTTTEWENGTLKKNPFGTVPVVPFYNRSRIGGHPFSDLMNVIPIQDAINKTVSDALTASEYAAYPQRWVTGLEIDFDSNGNPKEPFNTAVNKLLQAENEKASFGQFDAADLGNYATLVNLLVQHMSSISRTPSHYFLVNAGNAPSGEAIISAEAGLVAKVRERALYFGESWERVIRLCFQAKGDRRAEAYSMETIWRDPEYRTEAQHIDSLLKLKQLNVPEEMLWLRAGFTASEIADFREMRKEDAKAAREVQELGPQAQQPGAPGATQPTDKKAAEMAKKPPQGNAGNVSRKLNEVK